MEERLQELSAKGDDLERIAALVDFAMFRADLEQAVPRADGTKGGRPAFDHGDCREFRVWPVMMGKKELPHGPTERAADPRRDPGPAAVRDGCQRRL